MGSIPIKIETYWNVNTFLFAILQENPQLK